MMGNSTAIKVLVVDEDKGFMALCKKSLPRLGGVELRFASTWDEGRHRVLDERVDLVVADLSLGSEPGDGIDFVASLRQAGFAGKVVIATRNSLFEPFFRAARAGADGYLIKGEHLDLPAELARILSMKEVVDPDEWLPRKVESVGFFSSQGLTKRELELLSLFAEDFPRHQQLAARAGTKEGYIRRVFCRIYEKLNIDTMAQLAQLLTISAMYRYA